MEEVLNNLLSADRQLFVKINSDWTSSWADHFFPFITDFHKTPAFIALMVVLISIWVFRQKLYAMKWIVALVISLTLSDSIAYRVFKANIDRPRPPASGVQVVVRGPEHTGNSFPSNHATNMFAAATTLAGVSPIAGAVAFTCAALIGYSRVYVGAHFPLDVLAGAALGSLVAALVRLLLIRWIRSDGYFSLAKSSSPSSSDEGVHKEKAPET